MEGNSQFLQGIPEEPILNILSRLPVKVLIRFSCVCKLWFNLIHHDHHKTLNNHYLSSSHFLHYSLNNPILIFKFLIKKHFLQKHIPNYNKNIRSLSLPWDLCFAATVENSFFYLDKYSKLCQTPHKTHTLRKLCQNITSTYGRNKIGYCNGLCCFFIEKHGIIEVCNPSRRQILAISAPQKSDGMRCFGFGIDTVTKDYKIVCVFSESDCMVFTLGTDSWREITNSSFPGEEVVTDERNNSAVFCNGTLYWKSLSGHLLVAFNLQDEKFHVIQPPPKFVSKELDSSLIVRRRYDHMLEFVGSLCVAVTIRTSDRQSWKLHLYTLINATSTIDTKQEWIKKTLYLPPSVPISRNNIISYSDQLLFYWTENDHDSIMIYNLHTEKQNMVHQPHGFSNYEIINHIENFLSLETFVKEGTARFFDSYPCLKSMKPLKETSTGLLFLFSSS